VIVQEMAFGNCSGPAVVDGMDETAASLTGVVAHTRLGDDGVRVLEGECKFSAAGDDLVAGVTVSGSFRPLHELSGLMPMLARRLHHVVARLRRFHGTDQEVEFTVQRGVLSVLQTRTAEKGVDESVASFAGPGDPAARGIGIRGGAFRGLVAFGEDDLAAQRAAAAARDDVDGVLVVMENPTPDDIPLILSADGLLTARGGSSSHAAVAVNGLESRCVHTVMSAAGLRVDGRTKEAAIRAEDGTVLERMKVGDAVSVDGATGAVFVGSRSLRSEPATEAPTLDLTA
jgi:pyruvate,orthophosphate dikinase